MIRKAKPGDVEGIKALIDSYAKKDMLLPRSIVDIVSYLRDFFVFERGGKIEGCVALHLCWLDLGEIRSLTLVEGMQGKGIGKQLLQKALEEAKQFGLKRVFTLSYSPEFFEKSGFKRIDKNELPHKIWSICLDCPKFPNCNEIALVVELG